MSLRKPSYKELEKQRDHLITLMISMERELKLMDLKAAYYRSLYDTLVADSDEGPQLQMERSLDWLYEKIEEISRGFEK